MTETSKKRSPSIDKIRGFAILLMFFFHFFYDLKVLGHIDIDVHQNLFWYSLPRVIVFLFLLCVGLAFPYAHLPSIKWAKFWKRLLKIAISALVISVATYILFPKYWIYFGTLHCITLCSLLAIPFLKHPKISLVIAVILIGLSVFGMNPPWFTLKHKSMDYISPFPWFACVLLGIASYHFKLHYRLDQKISLDLGLTWLGKNSLIIYLVHQPIIFGTLWTITIIGNRL